MPENYKEIVKKIDASFEENNIEGFLTGLGVFFLSFFALT